MNGPDVEPTAEQLVQKALAQAAISGRIVEEMPQGASTRRFFRIRTEGGTLVAMFAPGSMGGPLAAKQASGHASFLAAQSLLHGFGLPVPAVHACVPEHDVIVVDDLGDETLAAHLLRRPERAAELYTHAVELLAHAQAEFARVKGPCIVHERAFDYDLLRFEIDHFLDYGLLGCGVEVTASQRRTFEAAAHLLASTVAELERGFVHRDYQSRNLMVRELADHPPLTWIDFQDAMLGPRAYDLVALLMDSYQNFAEPFVQARLHDYVRAAERAGVTGQPASYDAIRREFDLITAQRKLKDAGRFVYLYQVRQNPSFLAYVDGAIVRATAALERVKGDHPALVALAELLAELVPKRRSPKAGYS